MGFSKWLNEQDVELEIHPVISFDFDGVLHRSIIPGTTHPVDYDDWESWVPNEEMHKKVHEESRTGRVVVVSKRDDEHEDAIWSFIHRHNLPIEAVYVTNNRPKLPYLTRIAASRHYDDDPHLGQELAGSDIEFVFVKVRPADTRVRRW